MNMIEKHNKQNKKVLLLILRTSVSNKNSPHFESPSKRFIWSIVSVSKLLKFGYNLLGGSLVSAVKKIK